MTSISDQIAAIRAQLADDERLARAASPGPWDHGGDGLVWPPRIGDPVSGSTEVEDAEHIARWNPLRVLSEVAAKRRILDEAERYSPELEHGDNGGWAFEAVIKMLAQPAADHQARLTPGETT